jgi:transcriptional regulator with XRE-family HTH domain
LSLTGAAGISSPLLSRIEGGQRLPTREVLDKLCEGLALTPFERFQLRAIAGYESHYSEAPEMVPVASDALKGALLFLRTPEDDRSLALKSNAKEVWIVASSPLIVAPEFFNMLRTILLEKKTRYVWFIDKRTGELDARLVRERLEADKDLKEQGVEWWTRIEFVLSPPALCIANPRLGIYNPRLEENLPRYGRAIYVSGGGPVGLYSLDTEFVGGLSSFLMQVYDGCQAIVHDPKRWFPDDAEMAKVSGTFRLLKLSKPSTSGQS